GSEAGWKGGERVIERAAHPDRLRTLPRKQECDLRLGQRLGGEMEALDRSAGDHALRLGESGDELVATVRDEPDRGARARPRGQGGGDVGDRGAGGGPPPGGL